MIEIEYTIDKTHTSMLVPEEHPFYLMAKQWVTAGSLNAGDKILTCGGIAAEIKSTNKIKAPHNAYSLKISHNHNYFMTKKSLLSHDTPCDNAPTDPLNLIPYSLANRPANLPNGESTGDHAGPWAAARHLNSNAQKEVIGWGRANDNMCAEDAAVSNLMHKLGSTIELHRGNVEISHAYVRKYTRKGRIVNKISPCIQCRNNYGSALRDQTTGVSNLAKSGRGYLPP